MDYKKAEMLVQEYAAALNGAQVNLIPAFYTEDAVFMPDKANSFTKSDLLDKGQSYLSKNQFHISYSIQDIILQDKYAFVQATAQTKTVNSQTNKEVSKISQDLFVLRKEESAWKIFRYMFNSVKEQ